MQGISLRANLLASTQRNATCRKGPLRGHPPRGAGFSTRSPFCHALAYSYFPYTWASLALTRIHKITLPRGAGCQPALTGNGAGAVRQANSMPHGTIVFRTNCPPYPQGVLSLSGKHLAYSLAAGSGCCFNSSQGSWMDAETDTLPMHFRQDAEFHILDFGLRILESGA